MDPALVEQRLKLGEDSEAEFKSVARSGYKADAGKLAKAIVAFANSGGGRIFLGVEDDGSPTGVGSLQQADALMRQVTQVCRDGVHPPLVPRLTKVALGDATLLVVEIAGFAPDRPYREGGAFYIRDANRNREATQTEMRRLFESADHHYDESPVVGSSLADLDLAAAAAFVETAYQRALSKEQTIAYLRSLRALDEDGVPTVTGVVFFAHDPQRWLPDARISAVRMRGTEIALDVADRQEIGGRVLEQIEAARTFLSRHVLSPLRVEGWDRVTQPGPGGIPDAVLVEAVLNAVTHRDYRATSQVRIFVLDDRVEIINPGGLLNRLTLDSIREGRLSQRRNPILASLLTRAQRRENLGVGVPEMFRLMRDGGQPEPTIDLAGGHFRLVLRSAEQRP